MTFQIFDFSDYRAYLNALLKSYPKKGHGVRSVWAQKMNCQIAYVSHVLNGLYDLSTEQGESLARHLGFNKEETEFFCSSYKLRELAHNNSKSSIGNSQMKFFCRGKTFVKE